MPLTTRCLVPEILTVIHGERFILVEISYLDESDHPSDRIVLSNEAGEGASGMVDKFAEARAERRVDDERGACQGV